VLSYDQPTAASGACEPAVTAIRAAEIGEMRRVCACVCRALGLSPPVGTIRELPEPSTRGHIWSHLRSEFGPCREQRPDPIHSHDSPWRPGLAHACFRIVGQREMQDCTHDLYAEGGLAGHKPMQAAREPPGQPDGGGGVGGGGGGGGGGGVTGQELGVESAFVQKSHSVLSHPAMAQQDPLAPEWIVQHSEHVGWLVQKLHRSALQPRTAEQSPVAPPWIL